jgi:hypothetical protein
MSADAATKARPAHERILERYTKPVVVPTEEADRSVERLLGVTETGESEETAEAGCFGYLRGTREMAVMLELRKKDGAIMALSYSYIEQIEYDPSVGITIHALGRTIRIEGTNLNTPNQPGTSMRLYQGLTRHRVVWIGEASGSARLTEVAGVTLVTAVKW